MEMFTWLVHLSCNLSHIFAKGTCGDAERVDLSMYLQLVRLIWDHVLKARIQSICYLPSQILINMISIMIPWVQKIPSCIYRAMELIVPSPINDLPNRDDFKNPPLDLYV